MNIGESIQKLRKQKGFSQIKLAKISGINQTYLSLIENGNRNPSLQILEKICDSLDTKLPFIFWFSLDENDIKETKKDSYRILKDSIDSMVGQIL